MRNSTHRRYVHPFALTVAALLSLTTAWGTTAEEPFHLKLRSRVPDATQPGGYVVHVSDENWAPQRTAIIVCDMWDTHHCKNAALRGAELAPTMNRLLKTARDRGVLIIHSPSDCIPYYENHQARKRALAVPKSKALPRDITSWCSQIPAEEKGVYPIDQTDGGEDDDPAEHKKWAEELKARGRNPKAPWIKETDLLTIDPDRDYVSADGAEVWSILEHHGIEHVMLMGVHLNMCVLGRPFGLRQMAKNGRHVVLVRDLTDTMYNPAMPPKVSHFEGTQLMIEHVEKFVCPTITSDQILGGKPFRFRGAPAE